MTNSRPTRMFLIGHDNLFLHALEMLIAESDYLEHVGTAAPESDSCCGMLQAANPDLVALLDSQESRVAQYRHAVPHAGFVLIGCFCDGDKGPEDENDNALREVVGCIPWDVARAELVTLFHLFAEGHTVLAKAQRQSRQSVTKLTPRQREVLQLVSEGYSNKGIAKTLGVSACTVKAHMSAILSALEVPNRAAAASLWKVQWE